MLIIGALLCLISTLPFLSQSLKVVVKEEKIVTKIGDNVQMICSAVSEKVGCSFTSPIGKTFILNNKFAADEGGRIHAFDTNESGDCAMNITNIKQADSGTWRCNVTCTKCDNGKYDVGTNKIDVIVAIPPAEVYLTIDDNRVTDSIEMNLEETKTKSIKCIAAGAHFQPEFNWFLANSILKDVEISESKENVEDGKVNFMSSLVYKGDHEDFNKTLKCEVDHKGHTDTHLEDENNIAKAVLNLSFKPVLLKWSGENNVEVKFKANPEPTDCHWKLIAGQKEPNASLGPPIPAALAPLEKPSNDTFESCEILEAVTDGEYTAIFNSTLQKILFLEVTNELGTSEFKPNYIIKSESGHTIYVLIFFLIAIGIVICVFGLIYMYYKQKGRVGSFIEYPLPNRYSVNG